MTPAQITAKVNKGYAVAAKKVGFPFSQYRPTDPLAPLAAPLSTLPAAFDTNGRFNAPNGYAHPTWRGYFDGSRTLPGDYLVEVSPTQTGQDARIFFVAAQQPLLPILAVDCNETITIKRQPQEGTAGLSETWGGDVQAGETILISGWPCSRLQGTKGEKANSGIPSETRLPWYSALLPTTPGIVIKTGDIAVDANGIRYSISSVESTDLGWRLSLETDTP